LQLLQTITEDGRVLDLEIQSLKEWLAEHGDSTLPGVEYLRDTVEEVLRDGRVSDEERKWLQSAIEIVMPREERSVAGMRRREALAEDRTERKAAEEAAREQTRLNRPIARFDFMVAGVTHEGRAAVVTKYCRAGDEIFLVREPGNRFSRNAILVRLGNGMDIGYVPETEAQQLASSLDSGALQSTTIKKVLAGRKAPIPVIWGELYDSGATFEDARPMSDAPAPTKPTASGPGCAAALVASLILGPGFLVLLLRIVVT
jgi:hypothetical protein